MDEFKKSNREFIRLNSWNIFYEAKKDFDSNCKQFNEISQNIFECYYNFLSQEIDTHFDNQFKKFENSLQKFSITLTGATELIKNTWTNENIDELTLDQLIEKFNLINLDFVNLEQKTRFLIEKINTHFSTSCQVPKLKFSNHNLVKSYDIEEIPNPDAEKVLNIEKKRSSSFLNSKPIDLYLNKIKIDYSNSYICLEPCVDKNTKLINVFEKIVDRLDININLDLVVNVYTIDKDNRLACLYLDQNFLIDVIDPNDRILKLEIFDFKILDNGHLVTAEINNTLSIWEISHSRVKRIKRIIPLSSDDTISSQLKLKKISNNRIIFYLKGKLNLLVRNNNSYKIEKRISLNCSPNTKISIIKYSEKLGVAIVKENCDKVEIWCLESLSLKNCLSDHVGNVQSAAFLSETQLITGSNLNQVCIWNFSEDGTANKQREYKDNFYSDSIKKIKISKEKNRIVTLNDKNKIVVFDFELIVIYKIINEFQSEFSLMKPICITNEELIRIDGTKEFIQVYDIESGKFYGCFHDENTDYNLLEEINGEIITVSTESVLSKWTVNPNSKVCCFQFQAPLKKLKCFDPLNGQYTKPKKQSKTKIILNRSNKRF